MRFRPQRSVNLWQASDSETGAGRGNLTPWSCRKNRRAAASSSGKTVCLGRLWFARSFCTLERWSGWLPGETETATSRRRFTEWLPLRALPDNLSRSSWRPPKNNRRKPPRPPQHLLRSLSHRRIPWLNPCLRPNFPTPSRSRQRHQRSARRRKRHHAFGRPPRANLPRPSPTHRAVPRRRPHTTLLSVSVTATKRPCLARAAPEARREMQATGQPT